MRLLLVLVLTGALMASGRPETVAVNVYLNSGDGSDEVLELGTPLASEIFNKIGVRLNWRRGEPRAGEPAIRIRILEQAPGPATPEALASTDLADPEVVEIFIYASRVRHFREVHRNLGGAAVAYILAHELGHAMQGVVRHSEAGIMRANWSETDYHEMAYHKLAFTAHDVELIHQGLAGRLRAPGRETSSQRRSGPTAENSRDCVRGDRGSGFRGGSAAGLKGREARGIIPFP